MPQPHFKKIDNIKLLANNYLIHFTDTKDNQDPKDGKVKIEAIVRQTDHLRDYSNSLLGTFQIKDIFIELLPGPRKSHFNADWVSGGAKSTVPIHGVDFRVNEDRGYFFLAVSDFDGHEVPYSDESAVKPVCKVIHTPTNANFWHISLRWFHNGKDISELEEKERKKGDAKRVLTAAKALIHEKAFFTPPKFERIEKSLYS